MPDSSAVAPAETDLLARLLDTVQSGIVHCEAVRQPGPGAGHPPGPIIDFRMVRVNRRVTEMLGRPEASLLSQSILTVDPDGRENGVFARWVAVIDTALPDRVEHYIASAHRWFDMSVARLGDGVVVSLIDITNTKQAELRQGRELEQFRLVLNNALTAIAVLVAERNAEGQIIDFVYTLVNRASAQLAGIPADAMIGQRLLTLFPDCQPSGLFGAWVRLIETGGTIRYQEHYRGQDREAWYDMQAVKWEDGLIESYSDITTQMRAQIDRQQQADLLRGVLDGSLNGLIYYETIRSETGDILDFQARLWNEAALTITVQTANDLLQRTMLTRFPERAQPDHPAHGFYRAVCHTVETGEPSRYQLDFPHLNKAHDLSVSKLGDGCVISLLDVTELRRSVQALQGEAILFKTMSQNVPDVGTLVVNSAGRLLFIHGDLPPDLLTDDPARLLGKPVDTGIRPAHRTELLGYLRDALAGQSRTLVQEMGERVSELFVGPVRNDDQTVVMAMAIYRDISQTRRYQRDLEQSVADLRRSNASLEQFAYVASHDLQEPLRKIQQFGDVLQQQFSAQLPPTGVDIIGRMQSAAGRMSLLIRDLLDYSRLSVVPDVYQPVVLGDLLAGVVSDLSPAIDDSRATVTVGELPTVPGDAGQLHRLFQNLLSNAIKFREPDRLPVVTVTARVVATKHIAAPKPVGARGRYAEITVADNGVGFDEKYLDRIFVIFQRLHTRTHFAGTGIGLAICQKIVDNHQGYIRAAGQPGAGATFRVYLPVA
jgi:signal transduction histidine kinase/PAS domain-containing protein